MPKAYKFIEISSIPLFKQNSFIIRGLFKNFEVLKNVRTPSTYTVYPAINQCFLILSMFSDGMV